MNPDLIPWFLLAVSMATILIAPLLSDGPPQPPERQDKDQGRGHFSRTRG